MTKAVVNKTTTKKWYEISDFKGLYSVSKEGHVFSISRQKVMSPYNVNGYHMLVLQKDKSKKRMLVHRIVAQTFLKNKNNFPQVNHKDGNKTNNNVSNLEWCTASENKKHSWRIGTSKITAKFLESTSRNRLKAIDKITKYHENDIIKIGKIRETQGIGSRKISKLLNIPKSSIDYLLRNYNKIYAN